MIKKLFKKADKKTSFKVEKLSKKELNAVIGGAETLIATSTETTTSVHQELHRPPTY